jgi:hypothetical protein
MAINSSLSFQNSPSFDYEEDIAVEPDAPYLQESVVNSGVDNENSDQPSGKHRQRQVVGAAVVGGLAGLVFLGPISAVALAGGAAFVATTKGKAGEVARATGEVTAQAGRRLKRFEQKHNVVKKTSKGVVKGCNWVSKKVAPKETAAMAALD